MAGANLRRPRAAIAGLLLLAQAGAHTNLVTWDLCGASCVPSAQPALTGLVPAAARCRPDPAHAARSRLSSASTDRLAAADST